MKKISLFSPVILRVGLSLVFLWFGANQLMNTTAWIGYIPDSIVNISSLSAQTLVHINGVFEIIFGAMLFLGLFTRFAALLLALHMIDITFIVGLDATGIRDFGLSIATVAVWLNGMDFLTLDRFVKKDTYQEPLA